MDRNRQLFAALLAVSVGSPLYLAFALPRRAVPLPEAVALPGEAGPPGAMELPTFGAIIEKCPGCGRRVTLAPGRETRCRGCGRRLAACARCGTLLTAARADVKNGSGAIRLCEEHAEDARWEAARLEELDGPAGQVFPPKSPRAAAARRSYERRVRQVFASGAHPEDVLFPERARLPLVGRPDLRPVLPATVAGAVAFYQRAVTEGDFGSVDVFRWELDGSPLYVVRCGTDGSDGWVELYDGDGTPLGYARTEDDCPAWMSRGAARRRVFVGDPDETDAQVAEAAKRIRGR